MNNEKKFFENLSWKILKSGAFDRLVAIGITGSIGKGEKSIFDNNINDIDFFVIAEKFDQIKKLKLEKELREITNTKFTDILFLRRQKFMHEVKKKHIDQYLFDLLKSNCLLYALEEYATLLNKLKNKFYKVTYKSAVAVLLTRLWCLTGPYKVLNNKIVPIEESFTIYQLKKALSAIIDAVLICEKKYNSPRTIDKIENFKKTIFFKKNSPKILELINFFFSSNRRLYYDERIYKDVVNYYLYTIDYVIKERPRTYLQFPLKKVLIKSIFKKSVRNYIKSIIKRFKTLYLVNDFLGNSDNINSLKLSYLFKENYEEVMKQL